MKLYYPKKADAFSTVTYNLLLGTEIGVNVLIHATLLDVVLKFIDGAGHSEIKSFRNLTSSLIALRHKC